jgi:hypothetical protein
MRRTTLFIPIVTAVALAVASTSIAEDRRSLTETVPAGGLETLRLDAGVGDISVSVSKDDDIRVEVELIARRGGLFSSLAKSQRAVAAATLEVRRHATSVELTIDAEGHEDDRRFEERWTVQAPARLAIELELGVGDVVIAGMSGGIDVEVGVGDVDIDVTGGDVTVDVGVGDARVEGPAAAYGRVECSGGIGDSRIDVADPDRDIASEGFMGHSASWRGDGEHSIELEAGVGDVVVMLR